MVKILPLLALAAIVLKQNVAVVDLYEKPEWHPCNTNLAPKIERHLYYDFTPPNCVPVNHTTTGNCTYFSCTTKLQEIREVVYFRIRESSKGLSKTCHVPRLPPLLTILDLSQNWWDTIDADRFWDVSDLKFVGSLLLINTVLRNTKCIEQAVLQHLVNVECINMDWHTRFLFLGLDIIPQLLSLPKLKYFSARNSGLTYEHIQNFSIDSSSVSLWLSHNGIGDGIPYIGMLHWPLPFHELKNLTHLDLSYNKLSGFYTGSLQYRSIPTMRTLDLSGNDLEEFPMITWCDGDSIWGYWHLSTLNLSDNKISSIRYTPGLSAKSAASRFE
jgi:Leucine-rich repeat (LRR) protein